MQLHHQEDIWLHVIDFLGNGQFPLMSHLRLVNHQWFLLVNQSVRRLTLTQQFCLQTSKLLPVNYNQKERIAQLFHFLKQFTHVQVIQIYGFDHDVRMVHLSQLGRSYCPLLERFEMDGHVINACSNHLHLKQFLKACPHYKTLVLYAPQPWSSSPAAMVTKRNLPLSLNPQRCAKYIAKYGRNLEELYLSSSMEPFDFTDICDHCTKLNKVYIRASGSYQPFDLSGLKFIKSLSLSGENFSREGIERFIQNNVRNLESLALFVPGDLMDSILDGFAHTDHSISELSLTASSSMAEVCKLVPFITSNIANFQVLKVSHFHMCPIDTLVAETLSKCPRFTTLEIKDVSTVPQGTFKLLAETCTSLENLTLTNIDLLDQDDVIAFGSQACVCSLKCLHLSVEDAYINHQFLSKHTDLRRVTLGYLDQLLWIVIQRSLKKLEYLEVAFVEDGLAATIAQTTNIKLKVG